MVRKVARHYTNVLLMGATGTGKELVAKAIHQMSPVAHHKFVVCNCSAMVDTLLESQLFGHVRGSFTGATDTRLGLFEYANGGTVFLDEIGETSLAMQAKLLRVIHNREIQRVGSPEVRRVDVRMIAATNRDLHADVLAGRFREDLYYRLSTIQIRIPRLNERLDDVPLLMLFFLKRYNEAYNKHIQGFTRRAQIVLLQHSWPGNVRELENVIERAVILADNEIIQAPALGLSHQANNTTSHLSDDKLSLDDYFIHFVRENEHKMTETELARQLGVSRKTLWERRHRLGVPRKQ
jgi:transcriptional regulator with PAS, ATPase and Fis domain